MLPSAIVLPAGDLPLLAGLNPEQKAAVTLPPEHALILAGAGSGKTRVLTTRIAWLLQTGQVSPGGMLAVTFTNKAAKEMMTRLTAMLPVNVRGMWIGTFHGLCNRFLRAHHQVAGLPQAFQILDTQDQLSAIKRLCKQHNVDDERFPPKQLQWFISGCKEDGLRPRDVVVRDAETRRKVEIYQLYEEQCQREGVVDFGELMLRSYELLQGNEPIRVHYQRRFRHILIDEFQDTNRLQYAWIKMIAGLPAEGGDRGAMRWRWVTMTRASTPFAARAWATCRTSCASSGVQHQIKLEQNYRSHSNILDAANQLISHNQRRLGKNLRTDAGAGEPVRVLEAVSDFAEAEWVVDELRQLVSARATPRREVAVLYRSNAQSRVLETAAVQRRRALPGLWRPALLRARRNQARAGLPAPVGEPARRHQLSARGQLPAARHRRAQHRAVAGRGAGERAVVCTKPRLCTGGRAGGQRVGFRRPHGRAARAHRRQDLARNHRADAGRQRPDRALPRRTRRR
jgi:DNA helicase-2/ATP-dependent DNA helicase PcrA